MDIEIREQPMAALETYATTPIAFEVVSVFDVELVDRGLGGVVLSERVLDAPYVKDYDAIDGEEPAKWAQRFDVSHWGLLCAYVGGQRAGEAIIAYDTAGVHMLEGRSDLAMLWDLRVAPEFRGQGIGAALFRKAEEWAIGRRCRHLKVETQNTNVPACKFYARQGCVLGAINRFAYPELPDEVQLLWRKDLGAVPTPT